MITEWYSFWHFLLLLICVFFPYFLITLTLCVYWLFWTCQGGSFFSSTDFPYCFIISYFRYLLFMIFFLLLTFSSVCFLKSFLVFLKWTFRYLLLNLFFLIIKTFETIDFLKALLYVFSPYTFCMLYLSYHLVKNIFYYPLLFCPWPVDFSAF